MKVIRSKILHREVQVKTYLYLRKSPILCRKIYTCNCRKLVDLFVSQLCILHVRKRNI